MISKWFFIMVWLLLMLIAFGYLIGNEGGQGLLGALLGLLVFIGIYTLYGGIAFLWTRWQPAFPLCNKCRECQDYKIEETLKNGFRYRCSCGNQYIYIRGKSGEVKFVELTSEDKKRSYMKRSRYGRWKPDTDV